MNQPLALAVKPLRTRLAAGIIFAGILAISGTIALAANTKPQFGSAKPVPISVTARPLLNFAKAGSTVEHGQLIWRGGLVLSSQSENFGGYSGLILSPDGRELFAVSDAGGWLKARLEYDGERLAGLSQAAIGPLLAADGKPLRQRQRDAEEVGLSRGTLDKGEILVSFEQSNRITRHAISKGEPGRALQTINAPPGLERRSRDGMEAMTVLQGGAYKGRTVAFSENARDNGRHAGWIWIEGKPKPLDVLSHAGFALTSAASLTDGSLLLLERRFTLIEGVRMRLRRIRSADIKPGAVLDGELLIEADLTDEIDNMEGLAVHKATNGDTILTIISDDNFNRSLQRTLLLQFALPARAPI